MNTIFILSFAILALLFIHYLENKEINRLNKINQVYRNEILRLNKESLNDALRKDLLRDQISVRNRIIKKLKETAE